jgi:hypothetical protein
MSAAGLLFAALLCQMAAAILLLLEVIPMPAKPKPITRDSMQEAEALLVEALASVRIAIALCPEGQTVQKHDRDAANLAADLALDAAGKLKGQ